MFKFGLFYFSEKVTDNGVRVLISRTTHFIHCTSSNLSVRAFITILNVAEFKIGYCRLLLLLLRIRCRIGYELVMLKHLHVLTSNRCSSYERAKHFTIFIASKLYFDLHHQWAKIGHRVNPIS